MRKIILDSSFMKTEEMAHRYMRERLNVCGYFANNLDSLWDALSSYSQPLHIELIGEEGLLLYLGDYAKNIIDLFKELEEENSNIKFSIGRN